MNLPTLRQLAPTLLLAGLIAVFGAEVAHAQTATFQPLNTAFSSVLSFMTGTFATTAATIAVSAAGFMALTSRIPWSWCFSIVVGVALIFGGAQIVSSLSSGMATGAKPMESAERPHLDPLVGGLTRPPMMAGIPYVLFVVEFCLIVLIFINTKNLLMFLLVIPIHAIAYWLTVRDARFVDVILTRLGKCPMTRNRRFWGGDSYAP